ncbi:MAG TPA: hypothetical protein VEH29_16880 [Acidimicrobiales bacterium]|nr:hypothetical protein [Acidimicrobiales bacterium]
MITMWGVAPILAAGNPTLTSGQMDELWVTAVLSGVLAYAFAVYSRRAIGVYPWRVPPFLWGVFGVLLPVLSLLVVALARLTTRPVQPPAAGRYGPRGMFGANSAAAPGPPDTSAQSGGWPPPSHAPRREPPPPGQEQGPPAGQWRQPSPAGWQPPAPPQWQPSHPGQQAQAAQSWPPTDSSQGVPGEWQPGTPGAPAAPSWPPPLGPEAFQQPAGPGYPPAPPPYAGQVPPPANPWQPYGAPAYPSAPALPGPDGWAQPPPYVPAPAPPPLFGWYPDPTGRHEQRYWDGRHWSDRVSDNSVRGDDPLHPGSGPASGESAVDEPAGPHVAPAEAAEDDGA